MTHGLDQVEIEEFNVTIDDLNIENGEYIVTINIAPMKGKNSSN